MNSLNFLIPLTKTGRPKFVMGSYHHTLASYTVAIHELTPQISRVQRCGLFFTTDQNTITKPRCSNEAQSKIVAKRWIQDGPPLFKFEVFQKFRVCSDARSLPLYKGPPCVQDLYMNSCILSTSPSKTRPKIHQ